MADFVEKPASPDAKEPANPQQAAIERILMSWGDQGFHEFSRYRFAEEREWYEDALFYQRRQWLRWNDSSRRFDVVKQDPDRPKPMPVSNYFAKAISDNSNQLQKPRMTATPGDDSDPQRRAAEYAQRALSALDKETGFDILIPLLAKHVPLWGIGCTWDSIDTSEANGQQRLVRLKLKSTVMVSCADCGQSSPVPAPATPAGNAQPDSDPNKPSVELEDTADPSTPNMDDLGDIACPQCGSLTTVPYRADEAVAQEPLVLPKGKLTTEVVPIFEVYLPRACRNPNLAKRVIRRYRKSLGFLRDRYGDRAATIKAEAPYDVHQIYMEALRSLVNYNYMHEQTVESTTVTEIWADWDDIAKKVQDRLTQYWAQDLDQLRQAYQQGIYLVYAGGQMLDWGVNPWWDATEGCSYKPCTFFLWELDPANVYPKGLAVDLVPLQKRLNRLDSLVELALMANAAGKWLWPTTQTTKPPSGTPNEVVAYDTIGDGKTAPTFVQPSPFHQVVPEIRQQILADFSMLGNTLGPAQGNTPQNIKSFRGQAFAAQKSEENTNTQRSLWEQAHSLRYKKLLLMAQKVWSDPRKVRVAGFNGRFGLQQLTGEMLSGNYTLEFVPDSSRPLLPSEKKQAFAELLKSNMVDITDSSIREYILDLQNLDDVDLTDHLQYEKAERDLELVKQGQPPRPSPFQRPDIVLKVFANFTLTEEFEALAPPIQQAVLLVAQMAQQAIQQQQEAQMQAAIASATQGKELATKGSIQYPDPTKGGPSGAALGEAMSKSAQKSPLHQIPGHNGTTQGTQQAAHAQGHDFAEHVA